MHRRLSDSPPTSISSHLTVHQAITFLSDNQCCLWTELSQIERKSYTATQIALSHPLSRCKTKSKCLIDNVRVSARPLKPASNAVSRRKQVSVHLWMINGGTLCAFNANIYSKVWRRDWNQDKAGTWFICIWLLLFLLISSGILTWLTTKTPKKNYFFNCMYLLLNSFLCAASGQYYDVGFIERFVSFYTYMATHRFILKHSFLYIIVVYSNCSFIGE